MRRAWKWGIAAVAVAGVASWALWPRGPRLEWHTSPSVIVRGQTFKTRALIPVGWEWQAPISLDHGKSVVMAYRRPRQPTWLPPWLERILVEQDVESEVIIDGLADGQKPFQTMRLAVKETFPARNESGQFADRRVTFYVYYRRAGMMDDATCRRIAGSLRILREDLAGSSVLSRGLLDQS